MTEGYSREEVGYISNGKREEAYPVVQYSREKGDPKPREVDRVAFRKEERQRIGGCNTCFSI